MRKSILDKEIAKIQDAGVGHDFRTTHTVKALHTPNENIIPIFTTSVDVHRNYVLNISDITTVVFTVPAGDYTRNILPFRDKLYITLVVDNSNGRILERYKFLLHEIEYYDKSEVNFDSTIDDLNKDRMVRVEGQCVNIAIDRIRLQSVNSSYANTTVEAVIRHEFNKHVAGYTGDGGLLTRKFVMVPSDNKRVYQHIQVPRTTKVMSLPTILQNGDYGVYNANIGTYTQRYEKEEVTYVYPLHTGRLIDTYSRLSIIDSKVSELGIHDNTYTINDNDKFKEIKILASRDTVPTPDDEASIKNVGTGIEGIEAASIMTRSSNITETKVSVNAEEYTRTMVHRKLKDKSENVDSTVTSIGVTSNFYKHRGDVLKEDGYYVAFKWLRSVGDLLTPGMFVTYIREENGVITTSPGVLHGVTKIVENDNEMEVSILLVFIGNKGE